MSIYIGHIGKVAVPEFAFDKETSGRRTLQEMMSAKSESKRMSQAFKDRIAKTVDDAFQDINHEFKEFKDGNITEDDMRSRISGLLQRMDERIGLQERVHDMKVDRFFLQDIMQRNWDYLIKAYGGRR